MEAACSRGDARASVRSARPPPRRARDAPCAFLEGRPDSGAEVDDCSSEGVTGARRARLCERGDERADGGAARPPGGARCCCCGSGDDTAARAGCEVNRLPEVVPCMSEQKMRDLRIVRNAGINWEKMRDFRSIRRREVEPAAAAASRRRWADAARGGGFVHCRYLGLSCRPGWGQRSACHLPSRPPPRCHRPNTGSVWDTTPS